MSHSSSWHISDDRRSDSPIANRTPSPDPRRADKTSPGPKAKRHRGCRGGKKHGGTAPYPSNVSPTHHLNRVQHTKEQPKRQQKQKQPKAPKKGKAGSSAAASPPALVKVSLVDPTVETMQRIQQIAPSLALPKGATPKSLTLEYIL